MTATTDGIGIPTPASLVDLSDPGGPRLIGGRCPACEVTAYPTPAQCPRCWAPLTAWPLPRTGTLYTYSVVHVGSGGRAAPYTVGYVDLPGNTRVFAHLDTTDEHRLGPDQPVVLVLQPEADQYTAVWTLETSHG